MPQELQSLKPIGGAPAAPRRRMPLRDEFALAMLPTLVVLAVFAFVEHFSHQRLLFASLASSAFLIYLDPQHGTNRVRTLVLAQMLAAVVGFAAFGLLGPGHAYLAGGAAMVVTIVSMISLDAVHPPAVSTALAFAFRGADESSIALFGVAVVITALLVALQRAATWTLARHAKRAREAGRADAAT